MLRQTCGCRGNALYTHEQVRACLARATVLPLAAPLYLPRDVTLTAHYAGHVLGACMFHCRVGASDVLYTGDYNMAAERHLGAAKVPRLRPDLLITESTFGTAVRDSRRARERDFLAAVHAAVRGGGKVLVPVGSLGSAQELSLLVDGFWERTGLDVRPLSRRDSFCVCVCCRSPSISAGVCGTAACAAAV